MGSFGDGAIGRHGDRWRKAVGLSLVASIALTACGGSDDEESTATTAAAGDEAPAATTDPYEIVVVADVTGSLATSLGLGAAGVRSHVEAINEAGGINGRQLEVSVLDGQSNADANQALFRQALDEDPDALMHLGLSASITAGRSLLEGAPFPVFSASIPDDMLYPTPVANFFAVAPSIRQNVQGLVGGMEQLLDGSLEGKRIAIVNLQSPYSEGVATQINELADEMGFEVVNQQSIQFQVPSFTTQAADIASSDPDGVILVVAAPDTPTVVGGLTTAGVDVPMIEFTAGNTPEIFERVADENFHAIRESVDASDSEFLQEAAAAAGVQNDAKTTFFTDGWIMVELLRAALESCGAECDDAGLIAALNGLGEMEIDNEINFGPIIFSEDRHDGLSAMQIYGWDPEEQADVEIGDPVVLDG